MYDPRADEPAAAAVTLAVILACLLGVVSVGSAGAVDAVDSGSRDSAATLRAVTLVPALATDTPSLLTDTATLSTPTPTPDGTLSNVSDDIENTTETVTNTTGTVTNTTENTTGTVTNTTGTVTNITGTVTNTTESVTNATGSLTNATGTVTNTTGSLTNETGDLVNGTTDLAGTATVGVNASAGGGSTPTTATASRSATPAPTGTAAGAGAGASTARGDATGAESSSVTAVAPPVRGDGPSGAAPLGSPGGAAVGGLVVVAGVLAAAASKQVAATAPVAQGQELAWMRRAVRARTRAVAGSVRARLARLPRVLLPLGYSRYDDSDPLEHDVRASLFETVERSPGVNLSTLADGADVSLSSVRHHLRILEEENLLVSERIRGQRRYFLSNESRPELVAALDDAATEPVLRALAESGPASVSDLADDLGRDPSTISHHVSRLEDGGLVERERDGQSVRNSLAPVAERVLAGSPGAGKRPVATE